MSTNDTHTAEELRDVLYRNGFRPCDISACNCGSWHARFGLRERMDEITEMVSDAGHPLCNENGNLMKNALGALIVELEQLRALASRQDQQGQASEATVDELIELAGALERRRCISIAETVKAEPRFTNPPFTAGYELACEEIAHRIEHEEWVFQDPSALPLAGDAPLQGEGK